MAPIKEIRVHAIAWRPGHHGMKAGYYWTDCCFRTFTDDNGNSRYYVNSEETTKEEGNEEYAWIRKSNAEFQKTRECSEFLKREKKSADWAKKNGYTDSYHALTAEMTFRREVNEYDITYEQMIEGLKGSIDQYTDYIDNPRQQKEAEAANAKIYKEIAELEKLIAERK